LAFGKEIEIKKREKNEREYEMMLFIHNEYHNINGSDDNDSSIEIIK
jgi:hypothetical protein